MKVLYVLLGVDPLPLLKDVGGMTVGFRVVQCMKRYEKFHEPITIEPADCRLAAKTGKFKLNGRSTLSR